MNPTNSRMDAPARRNTLRPAGANALTVGGLAVGAIALGAHAQQPAQPAAAPQPATAAEVSSAAAAQGPSLGAGPGGFVITSEDEAFRLRIGGYAQFRYLANFSDEVDNPAAASEEFTHGFEIPRFRILLTGRIHDRIDFTFLPAAGSNGSIGVDDAFVGMKVADKATLTIGQFKSPFLREWAMPETQIQLVERSVVSTTFSLVRFQGAMLTHTDDNWRAFLVFGDGGRTQNTTFTSTAESDYAVTGRVEYKTAGSWGMFASPTALGTKESGLLLGGAFHHQGDTDAFGGQELSSLTQWTVDALWEANRVNVFASVVGRHADAQPSGFSDYGLVVQAGYFVTEKTELVGRYAVILFDDGYTDTVDAFNEFAVGVNHYIAGHAVKLTGDVVFAPDELGRNSNAIGFGQNTLTGLLNDADSQVVLRGQLQFIF